MTSSRASRPIPLALTALVAFFAALAALAVSNGHAAHAHSHPTVPVANPTATAKAAALRADLRVLWEDHITWTRLAIISLTTDSPDTQATVARLLENQTAIGNAVKPFYGKQAGSTLTAELRTHILVAADVVAAAKAGDAVKLAAAQARWQQNANAIARVLATLNPRFWKPPALKEEMRRHLELTTEETVARLKGDWAADVAAYDTIHHHILHLSDLLADGIVAQFPRRFR